MKHYVICGFPRAGSTMLYLMFKHSTNSCKFYDKEMPALQVLSCQETQMTKRPRDIFKVNQILEKTDAEFILTIRDPRDILTSIHANSEGQYKVNWDYSLKTGRKGITGKTEGLLQYWKAIKNVPEPIVIYYEDLVKNPDENQMFLETQIPDFEFRSNFSDFYKKEPPGKLSHQLNGIRPPSVENIGRWKNHPERIKQQFEECPQLFDVLIELGYEDNKEWITNL
jgi:hypothetical protein